MRPTGSFLFCLFCSKIERHRFSHPLSEPALYPFITAWFTVRRSRGNGGLCHGYDLSTSFYVDSLQCTGTNWTSGQWKMLFFIEPKDVDAAFVIASITTPTGFFVTIDLIIGNNRHFRYITAQTPETQSPDPRDPKLTELNCRLARERQWVLIRVIVLVLGQTRENSSDESEITENKSTSGNEKHNMGTWAQRKREWRGN